MKINTEIDGKSITITLTKEQLEEIKQQTEPEKWQDKLVQPNKEDYYYLAQAKSTGELGIFISTCTPRKPELVFETRQQAQLLADKCNLMIEMHNYAYAVNDGWIPDWNNNSQYKYGTHSDYTGKIHSNNQRNTINDFLFGIVVNSHELAKEMLQEFGARLEKLYNQQY